MPTATRFFIGLGSNIDAEANLPASVRLLGDHGRVLRVSRVYETRPVGFLDQPNFLNAAVLLESDRSAEEVLEQVVPQIESALGRVRDPQNKNGPRTIDLDLVLTDPPVVRSDGRSLPDPDILRFAHLAIPLAELDPDFRHPTDGRTLSEISAGFAEERSSMDWRADVVLGRPSSRTD